VRKAWERLGHRRAYFEKRPEAESQYINESLSNRWGRARLLRPAWRYVLEKRYAFAVPFRAPGSLFYFRPARQIGAVARELNVKSIECPERVGHCQIESPGPGKAGTEVRWLSFSIIRDSRTDLRRTRTHGTVGQSAACCLMKSKRLSESWGYRWSPETESGGSIDGDQRRTELEGARSGASIQDLRKTRI
jgi:hypothetical protein